MDRLHAVAGVPAARSRALVAAMLAASLLAACDALGGGDPPQAQASQSRVEAVAPKASGADPLAGFCDVRAEAGQGKPFHFPAVDQGEMPAQAAGSTLWLNLWATWCKPCVEEMPMIAAWQKGLATQGKALDLRFVSVDEDAQTIAGFRAQHPQLPPTQKLASAAALAPYVSELGLDSGAGLPIHVFVDKSAHVRCVRAGAIADSHQAIVASMLQ